MKDLITTKLMRNLLGGTFLSACLAQSAQAVESCNEPSVVEDFLRADPTWKVVETKSLEKSDQSLWARYHRGLCPGLATIDFKGNGTRSYALALTRQVGGKMVEKLIILSADRTEPPRLLYGPDAITNPLVVWRAPPGKSFDYWTRKEVLVPHDSVVYEQMESWAEQFYLTDGSFKTLLTAY